MFEKNMCVHTSSIQTTSNKIWEALTTPNVTKKYWFGFQLETDWNIGSKWKLVAPDGKVHAAGEIVEIDRPRHIIITWQDEIRPELMAEGYSRCTIDLEPHDVAVDITITHTIDRIENDSKLIALVAVSWPKVISNLKSFLETDEVQSKL